MAISEADLNALADDIIAKLSKGNNNILLAELIIYVAQLGFDKAEEDQITRLVFAKTQYGYLKPIHILVLVHGIRTHAPWHGVAESVLAPMCTRVVPLKYDFRDVFRFLGPFRKTPIRHVESELRDLVAANPNAHISIVAHSFGTYIISQILRRSRDIRPFRLLLCGSVIKLKYVWGSLPNRPMGGIMNDIGMNDRLPIIAEITTWGYGASGTYGFGTNHINDNFHNFGHSGFFTAPHIETYWAPFLFNGSYIVSPHNAARLMPGYGWDILRLAKLKYPIVVGVAYLIYLGLRAASHHMPRWFNF